MDAFASIHPVDFARLIRSTFRRGTQIRIASASEPLDDPVRYIVPRDGFVKVLINIVPRNLLANSPQLQYVVHGIMSAVYIARKDIPVWLKN